jgi:gamma-glutamyltranspeptidase/glutathione hydrolase
VAVESKGIKDEKTDENDRGSPGEIFGLSEDIVAALEAKGHKVRRSKGEFSGLHIIYRNPDGSLVGGADPRREGTAVGLD